MKSREVLSYPSVRKSPPVGGGADCSIRLQASSELATGGHRLATGRELFNPIRCSVRRIVSYLLLVLTSVLFLSPMDRWFETYATCREIGWPWAHCFQTWIYLTF